MKKLLHRLPPFLGLMLLVAAVYVVQRQYRELRLADITDALAALPGRALVVAAGWNVLAYGVLTFYDRLASIYAGHKVSYLRTSFASFCAYVLSHNLGFAAVSGAAVRYRLYAHWGLNPYQIAKVVAFCSLTFGLGGMVLGGAILFGEPQAVPFAGQYLPRWVMYVLGAGLWAVVALYLTLARTLGRVKLLGCEAKLPGWRMALVQVLLATVDVAVTAAIFYALLPPVPGLTYLRFLAVYLASYSAGLLASLPGGLGVFDTAVLLGLSPYLPAPTVLGAIVVFRLYYYVIPLFLAGGMFAGHEVLVRSGRLAARERRGGLAWQERDFIVAAIVGVVTVCGAMLMACGLIGARLHVFQNTSGFAAHAGEYVPSLMGTALMVLAVGLSLRVSPAWYATLGLLLFSAVFVVLDGGYPWMAVPLMGAAGLLAPFRRAFHRPANLWRERPRPAALVPVLALVGCVIALAAFTPHARRLNNGSWWQIVFSSHAPNVVRVTVGLAVCLAVLASVTLLVPGRVAVLPWVAQGRRRYLAFGALAPEQADGLVLGDRGRAGIPFRRLGRVLLGLGDPKGASSDRISAIWRLRDLAEQEGLDPAVLHAGSEFLCVYSDLGLTALPLDAQGRLAVASSPETETRPEDPPHSYLCCMAERDLEAILPLLPDAMLSSSTKDAHAA